MGKIFFYLFVVLLSLNFAGEAHAEAEKTKVCVAVKDKEGKEVKDAKGNTKQNCKEMKRHQKLDGKKISEK